MGSCVGGNGGWGYYVAFAACLCRVDTSLPPFRAMLLACHRKRCGQGRWMLPPVEAGALSGPGGT